MLLRGQVGWEEFFEFIYVDHISDFRERHVEGGMEEVRVIWDAAKWFIREECFQLQEPKTQLIAL